MVRLRDDTASTAVTAQAAAAAPAVLRFVSAPTVRTTRALAAPLVFELTDGYGNPVSGRLVGLRSSSGAALPARVTTDAHGRGQVR